MPICRMCGSTFDEWVVRVVDFTTDEGFGVTEQHSATIDHCPYCNESRGTHGLLAFVFWFFAIIAPLFLTVIGFLSLDDGSDGLKWNAIAAWAAALCLLAFAVLYVSPSTKRRQRDCQLSDYPGSRMFAK